MKIIEGYIPPSEHTQGDINDIYVDKTSNDVYKCTGITGVAKKYGHVTIGADATNTEYVWEKLGGASGQENDLAAEAIEEEQPDVEATVEE